MYKDCPVQPSSVICTVNMQNCLHKCLSLWEWSYTFISVITSLWKVKLVTAICHSYGKTLHAAVSTYTSYCGRCTSCTVLLDWHQAVCLHHTKKTGANSSCPCSHSSTESHNKLHMIIMPSTYPCSHVCSDAKLCNHKWTNMKLKKMHKIN